MRKLLKRFEECILQPTRWRWIMTTSLPICFASAVVGWPSFVSALAFFTTGLNAATVMYLWHPRTIPFVVLPPTPEDLAKMEREFRAHVEGMLDRIARERGFAPADDEVPPPIRRH